MVVRHRDEARGVGVERVGAQLDLHFDDDTYAYARRDAFETVVVALNRAAAPKELTIPAAYLGLRDGARFEPLLAAKDSPAVAAGSLKLSVPARSAVFYKLAAR